MLQMKHRELWYFAQGHTADAKHHSASSRVRKTQGVSGIMGWVMLWLKMTPKILVVFNKKGFSIFLKTILQDTCTASFLGFG